MTDPTTESVIRGYTRAWTKGDLAKARTFLADDLDFQGSLESHTSADAFIQALGLFYEHLMGSHFPLKSVFEANQGFLLYDCSLKTGAGLRCAEYFKVEAGKITQIRLVFDTGKLPPPPEA